MAAHCEAFSPSFSKILGEKEKNRKRENKKKFKNK
jgi:hypothetical protein